MVLEVVDESKLKVVITKFINHKFFIVFTLVLFALPNLQCSELAAYRYGCLRQEIADLELKIKEVKDIVKAKNPYLLSYIKKL